MTASSAAPSATRLAGPARRRPGEFSAGGRKFTPRRKVCQFCVDKIKDVDYKDLARLRRFLSERGKIEPRRKTGTCAAHQRSLNVALKRARQLALLPFTAEHIRVTGVLVREPGTPPFRGARPRPQELEGAPEAVPEGALETDGAAEARADGQAAAATPSPAPAPMPATVQPTAESASPPPARETAASVPSAPEA